MMVVRSPLFKRDTFNLLAGEFATNLSYYRNYTDDDAIASMFLGCALDIIDCTYYSLAKLVPSSKEKIFSSLAMGWQEDYYSNTLPEDLLDPSPIREIIDHHRMILDAIRAKYQLLVRGPRDICWKESTASIAENRDVCRSQSRCQDETAAIALEKRCIDYFKSWRKTMMAPDNLVELQSNTSAIAEAIRCRCRILSLLTIPEGLSEFLSNGYGKHRPEKDMRTLRGVIVRLLTMLVDESLTSLNRGMNLPPDEALYFSRPAT